MTEALFADRLTGGFCYAGANRPVGLDLVCVARTFSERKRNSTGQHFWARGYFASAVGKDEEAFRKYIQEQAETDRRLDQLTLFDE